MTTKIINVLKDDKFEEILDIFKSTPAGEVILVLPKVSRAFKKEEHFSDLRDEADNLEKTVSFLCSNPEINELAKKYDFDVLMPKSSASPKRKTVSHARAPGSINLVNEIEEFYERPKTEVVEEPEEEADEKPEEEYEEAVPVTTRRMDDVIRPADDEERSVKIASKKDRGAQVGVHHDFVAETTVSRKVLDEIKGIKRGRQTWLTPEAAKTVRVGRNKRIGITLAGVGLIAVVGFVFMTTGSAKVTIKPASKQLNNLKVSMSASDSNVQIDPAAMKLPGQLFNIQKSFSQDFPATGQKDVAQKARGTITVYNETSTPQSLIATTRFESADQHIFRTLTNTSVPANGHVDVQLVADKAGQDYNVTAGKFTIPAFSEKGDSVKFEKIYGTSSLAMHGGTSGKAKVVTEDDFNKAKAALTEQVKAAVAQELGASIAGLKVINDSKVNVDSVKSTAQIDDAADTFTMTLTGSLKTVGFKESDAKEMLNQYELARNGMTIVPEKISIDYQNIQFDTATNTLHFDAVVTGSEYAKVDQEALITNLIGKKSDQIKEYLQSLPQISSANVLLSPLWVRSVPKNPDKIHILMEY